MSWSRATPSAEEEIERAARDLGEALGRLLVGHARLVAERGGRAGHAEAERQQAARLLSAKEVAALLDFKGKRPEKSVYEMVADGRIPRECVVMIGERGMRFHPVRIQRLIDGGGFVKGGG